MIDYPIQFNEYLLPQNTAWAASMPECKYGQEPVAYLAGPMRGYQMQNFPAFAEAAIKLRRHGWFIESPAEYDLASGVDPSSDSSEWPIQIEDMLRTDFRLILERCNAVILLPGWRESVGARLEIAVAFYTGLPILELDENTLVKIDIKSAVPHVIEEAE